MDFIKTKINENNEFNNDKKILKCIMLSSKNLCVSNSEIEHVLVVK